jgi:Zn-dependent peptidase ImmA (M78 family)
MRITEARAILAEYQALLDLGEWTIQVRWSHPGELEPDEWAAVRWNTDTATADMYLNRRVKMSASDVRETIVHELLHVTLQGHADHTGTRDPMYERGLNRVAAAILAR